MSFLPIGFVVKWNEDLITQDRFVEFQGVILSFMRKSKLPISYVSLLRSLIGLESSIVFRVVDIDDISFDLPFKAIHRLDRKVVKAFEMKSIGFF